MIVAAFVTMVAAVGPAVSRHSAVQCGPGSVSAVINGKHRCLRPRQRCSARFERTYARYSFHCHRGVLWADAWAPLRLRRLHLPTVGLNGPCPRTPARQVTPSFGVALDDGTPPYPLSFVEGLATYSPSDLQAGGWLYHKTIWIAPLVLRGPVLVRGRQLDGRHILRFSSDFGAPSFRELRLNFHGGDFSGGWQEALGPRYTLIRAPGCYGLQVDGADFSKVLVFEVRQVAAK
jgi:hypothetical protein